MNALRAIYRYWISLLALVVIVQIGLAGYGAFYAADKVSDASINEDTFEDGFGAHIGLGYLIFLRHDHRGRPRAPGAARVSGPS